MNSTGLFMKPWVPIFNLEKGRFLLLPSLDKIILLTARVLTSRNPCLLDREILALFFGEKKEYRSYISFFWFRIEIFLTLPREIDSDSVSKYTYTCILVFKNSKKNFQITYYLCLTISKTMLKCISI